MQKLIRRGILAGAALAVGASVAGGTALAQVGVEVTIPRAPPPPRTEVIPVLPPDRIEVDHWRPGHWRWDGDEYVWVPGRYVTRPQRSAVWVPARWEQRPNGWVYIEGHWN
jgi:hypothetical protein